MRWVFCFAMVFGMASPALAADYDLPILRGTAVPVVAPVAPVMTVGPATFTRWSGFYVGGVASYNNATTDFATATQPLFHFSLRSTTLEQQVQPSAIAVLGRGADIAFGGGAFLGYNTQWQDLIIGVEATYTHTNLNTTATASAVARISPSRNRRRRTQRQWNGLNLTDYGEARFRAGYVVGNLLPYGFMGLAVGRASYSLSTVADVAQATNTSSPDYSCLQTGVTTATMPVFLPLPTAPGKTTRCSGASLSVAGLDWALTQNFFLRGEFEFVQFAPISNINLPLISGRVGGGLSSKTVRRNPRPHRRQAA